MAKLLPILFLLLSACASEFHAQGIVGSSSSSKELAEGIGFFRFCNTDPNTDPKFLENCEFNRINMIVNVIHEGGNLDDD